MRGAKTFAEAVLPATMVVWRGAEARPRALAASMLEPGRLRRKPGRIALTFDDGPLPLTLDYLAVLERLEVRATFFVVGELCAARPDLVAAIAAGGHELAGHGYTHRRFTKLTERELLDELDHTQALLPPTMRRRALVRPPHGAVSLRSLVTCSRGGFTSVLWSLDSGDWRDKRAADVERTLDTPAAGAGEIILLHEGQTWTMQALPAVVAALRGAGNELVTVGELLD